ncbi:MAG: hypothetical protein AABY83_14065 [Pseudomonadota bacterium]
MFSLFKKLGVLEGIIDISGLPPFCGHAISLSLFAAPDTTGNSPQITGDPPHDALQNEEKITEIFHFDHADDSGAIQERFHLRRAAGRYYLQLNITLYRPHQNKMYAQVERFFFRKRAVEIVLAEDKYIVLPIIWPIAGIEELEIYRVITPGNSSKNKALQNET